MITYCSALVRNEILTANPEYSCWDTHWYYNIVSKLRVSKPKSEIQDGGFETSVAQISADTNYSNEIRTATFTGSGHTHTVPCLDMSLIKDGGY